MRLFCLVWVPTQHKYYDLMSQGSGVQERDYLFSFGRSVDLKHAFKLKALAKINVQKFKAIPTATTATNVISGDGGGIEWNK